MANPNKTKAEILQELESIKGLLLEEDDIPILQTVDEDLSAPLLQDMLAPEPLPQAIVPPVHTTHPSVLPGQTSLFGDEETPQPTAIKEPKAPPVESPAPPTPSPYTTKTKPVSTAFARPLTKASGENPFLPQHIRDRLRGNNPPPLFEFEAAKKIVSATRGLVSPTPKTRQGLINEVIASIMPQVEIELRHKLLTLSTEDLEKLLNDETS